MKYTKEQKLEAKKLRENGENWLTISKKLNIPRGTIKYWFDGGEIKFNKQLKKEFNLKTFLEEIENDERKKRAYSYILGLYLGDGHITKTAKKDIYRLRIFLHDRYKNLNEYALRNLQEILVENKCTIFSSKDCALDIISVYKKNIKEIFPQHGEGLKHKRKIKLEKWQKEIIDPLCFIQGLFHSDGSYVQGKNVFYQFTNMSTDIKKMYLYYCKKIGVQTSSTDFNKKNIYIYKKNFVKYLEEKIGTKTEIIDLIQK